MWRRNLLISVAILAILSQGVTGLNEGCLSCGEACLGSVQAAVPTCIAAGLDYSAALIGCVTKLLSLISTECQTCIKSLVCCVTDSCSLCDCGCTSLLQFRAPVGAKSFQEFSWLFQPQCHFAYIGNPACEDCEGKNVYQSVNCSESMYLHYHDYFLDGRWVLTKDLDDDDTTAVVRNLGDGFDDEECPEKEDYAWEMRSKSTPDAGWFFDEEIKLVPFASQEEILKKAKAISVPSPIIKLLNED